jgi:NhaB family Na+:H+ antiporter
MHGAVGTALGGVCTLVGEPQNLLIASVADWDFIKFLTIMAPVTMPVLFFGLTTCALLEVTGKFGYGAKLPENVRLVLEEFQAKADRSAQHAHQRAPAVQALVAVILVWAWPCTGRRWV